MDGVTLKACVQCGDEFEPKRSTARFCSPKCRVAYGRRAFTEEGGDLVAAAELQAAERRAVKALTTPVPKIVADAVVEHEALKTRIASVSKPLFGHCKHCRDDGHGLHLDACRQGCP